MIDLTVFVRKFYDRMAAEPEESEPVRSRQAAPDVVRERSWGNGVFVYSKATGLVWTPEGDTPEHVRGALDSAGFMELPDGSWRMVGTLDKGVSEIRKRRIDRFVELFGFDFRWMSAA